MSKICKGIVLEWFKPFGVWNRLKSNVRTNRLIRTNRLAYAMFIKGNSIHHALLCDAQDWGGAAGQNNTIAHT